MSIWLAVYNPKDVYNVFIYKDECCNIDQLNYNVIEYVLCTQKRENYLWVKDDIVHNRHIRVLRVVGETGE